ncbi:hypothetical protein V5H41_28270, partial [Salmonella enterica]
LPPEHPFYQRWANDPFPIVALDRALDREHFTSEMRCIEHLLQRQVDAIIVSTSLPPEHPFYQRWANDPFPIVALDRALDREHFTS